jgi:hypothetical protein
MRNGAMGLKEEVTTGGMSERGRIATITADLSALGEQQGQARLRKWLRVASQNQRSLKDDGERESNEDFYRGCHPPGDVHNRHNVDTFVVPYAYNLYNDRPMVSTGEGGMSPASVEILNMAMLNKSIRALDELIEYYVIDYLHLDDCAIDGLYMVDRTPTDHVQVEAIGIASVGLVDVMYDPSCRNTTDTLCVPIRGGITVEFDANVVAKEELQDNVLSAIEHAMDNGELIPKASAIHKTVFVGPHHVAIDQPSTSKKHDGAVNNGANNGANDDPFGILLANDPMGSNNKGDNATMNTAGIIYIGGIVVASMVCLMALYIRCRSKKSRLSYQNMDADEGLYESNVRALA